MLLNDLSRLRPLFLVAVVLSWNALFLAIEAVDANRVPTAAVLILAAGNLALAVIAGCVKEAGWAHDLAVRPEVELHEVRAVLWIVTFISLAAAMYGLLTLWESQRL